VEEDLRIQSWSRVRASESTKHNNLVDSQEQQRHRQAPLMMMMKGKYLTDANEEESCTGTILILSTRPTLGLCIPHALSTLNFCGELPGEVEGSLCSSAGDHSVALHVQARNGDELIMMIPHA